MTPTLNTTPVITGPLSELDVRRFLKFGILPGQVNAAIAIVCNTALSLTWFAVMIAAAYWVRFDAPIWGGF